MISGSLDVLPLTAAGADARFAAAWDALAEAYGDIYYRRDYLSAAALNESGETLVALWRGVDGAVLYPIVCRPLDGLPVPARLTHGRCDLVTPFEYGGPLVVPSTDAAGAAARLRAGYDRAFAAWCADRRVVAEFIRFHPLLGAQQGWDDTYTLRTSAANVVLDLAKDDDTLLADMRSATRRAVRASEHRGVEVRELEAAAPFAALYHAGMDRLGAAPQYYFPPAYFDALRRLDGAALLAAWSDRGQLAGVAAFIAGRRFAHYHLGATDRSLSSLRPMNALFFAAARRFRARGCRWLHLGSAAGSQVGLRSFKEGFSTDRRDYAVGTRIHDAATYRALADAAGAGAGGFFPAYRAMAQAA